MIYIDPGERRADTMNIVGERLAQRNAVTGEFQLIATACGYLDLVLKNLAGFFEAGVIEARGTEDTDGWRELVWTKTGYYLWEQWRNGPARRVVELPKPVDRRSLPGRAQVWLNERGGVTVDYVWNPCSDWVVECTHERGDGSVIQVVYLFSPGGRYLTSIHGRADAAAYAAAILAASL